jgi:hypothetical protein
MDETPCATNEAKCRARTVRAAAERFQGLGRDGRAAAVDGAAPGWLGAAEQRAGHEADRSRPAEES